METGNVQIVENAIDIRKFTFDNEEKLRIRNAAGLNGDFVVGHVGRFSYQKNHEKLVAVFYGLTKIRKNVKLLLVGTGELENQVKQQVKEYGIEKNVIFAGTTKNMKDMYALMDVFVLPSRYEGFPVVSVEVINESDDNWATKIIECAERKRNTDLDELYSRYDIVKNAKHLDLIYRRSLEQ